MKFAKINARECLILCHRPCGISVAFVRPSVCPSVAYIANNSRTQIRPSVPKFGMKVPYLRCDSHTSFKVKWSKVRVTDGRGHTVSAERGGHTACWFCACAIEQPYCEGVIKWWPRMQRHAATSRGSKQNSVQCWNLQNRVLWVWPKRPEVYNVNFSKTSCLQR